MCLSPKRVWRSHWNYARINLIIPVHSTRPDPFKLVQRQFHKAASMLSRIRREVHTARLWDGRRKAILMTADESHASECGQDSTSRQLQQLSNSYPYLSSKIMGSWFPCYTETNHRHCDAAIKFNISFTILRLPQNISYFWLYLIYNFRYHFTICFLVNPGPTFICALPLWHK
jgi:hypothetical protein